MSESAKKSDPKLWDRVKNEVTEGEKGGKAGQWSARKAQLAVSEYKKKGGGYEGKKSDDNHLKQWTEEEWGTKSGGESGKTGERYLPKKARDGLTKDEYARSTRKKRADTAKGKQHSAQPEDVARKTASARDGGAKAGRTAARGGSETKASLMKPARERDIPGRSGMSKGELAKALGA